MWQVLSEKAWFNRYTNVNIKERSRHQSKVENFFHLVWATRWRQQHLSGEWERAAHRCLRAEASKLGATISVAQFVNQIKGTSSALLNDLRDESDDVFRWQGGYACFSLSRSHLSRVVAYVDGQKLHHAHDKTWPQWEETEKPA